MTDVRNDEHMSAAVEAAHTEETGLEPDAAGTKFGERNWVGSDSAAALEPGPVVEEEIDNVVELEAELVVVEAEGRILLAEEGFLVVVVGDSCKHGSSALEAARREEEHIAAELESELVKSYQQENKSVCTSVSSGRSLADVSKTSCDLGKAERLTRIVS